jgi:hypothetical protein
VFHRIAEFGLRRFPASLGMTVLVSAADLFLFVSQARHQKLQNFLKNGPMLRQRRTLTF